MSNPLTGDYEAVLEISVRAVNGILATLHQLGGSDDAPLKLLHRGTFRVGDPPRRRPDLGALTDWVVAYQDARPGRGLDQLVAELTSSAPPGVAKRVADAIAALGANLVVDIPPDVVRGTAKLQISTLTLSAPAGSTSEFGVRAGVRAVYYPDPNTSDLPSPVHGDVHATFDVRKSSSGSRRLLIRPSADDAKIGFTAAPGSGMTAIDESRIAAQVRTVVRSGLTLLPIDLPSTFSFTEFRAVGSGAAQVIALPLQLSGAPAPANGLQSLTQAAAGSAGFAFAVAKEYVSGLVDMERIRQAIQQHPLVFKLQHWGVTVSVTYHLRFSSGPALTFKNGGIEVSGRVEVETGTWWAPNGFVTFRQVVTLSLDAATQIITLEPVGQPDVDESWFIPHGTAVNVVTSQIAAALASSAPAVRQVFADAKESLLHALQAFDTSASAGYSEVAVTPNGVVVRGEFGGAIRMPPVVAFKEMPQGSAFTAIDSWIPAGELRRFVWSWVEHSGHGARPWSGVQKSVVQEHAFILPKPAGITSVSQICLRIEGTQTLVDGGVTTVAGGTTCQLPAPDFTIDVPPWWDAVTLPIWRPDIPPDMRLEDAIVAHVSVQPHAPRPIPSSQNTLIAFIEWQADDPFAAIRTAIGRARLAGRLEVIAVLPEGAFGATRRDIETRLGTPGHDATLHVTEDSAGGWARTFGVTRLPAAYLVDARRKTVWSCEGAIDAGAMADALSRHVTPTSALPAVPLRLAVQPGDRTPDAVFTDSKSDVLAMHRFRGREVLLNFWQEWSAPCLKELSRLQALIAGSRQPPAIVAFHGGAADRLESIRQRLGLTYPLVDDADQRVSARYGVTCWPTTITVDAAGRIKAIDYGFDAASHHRADGPPDTEQR